MDTRDYIDREASLDDDEDELVEEDFDPETGEVRRKQADGNKRRNKDFEDSSEEEDDDDDEEAERVCHQLQRYLIALFANTTVDS